MTSESFWVFVTQYNCNIMKKCKQFTSQLSVLCLSGLHNVGLDGADTDAAVDLHSSFHESRRQSQLLGCSFEVLSSTTDACWTVSQQLPGSGLWNACVHVITEGPCKSQKWHRDMIAFILSLRTKHSEILATHFRVFHNLFTNKCVLIIWYHVT